MTGPTDAERIADLEAELAHARKLLRAIAAMCVGDLNLDCDPVAAVHELTG